MGSWHSTTELLPHSCVFRYLTVRQGLSRFRRLSILSRKSIQTMGSDRKMDSKTDSKRRAETGAHPAFDSRFPGCSLPSHDNINISQWRAGRFRAASGRCISGTEQVEKASPFSCHFRAMAPNRDLRRPAHFMRTRASPSSSFLLILADHQSANAFLCAVNDYLLRSALSAVLEFSWIYLARPERLELPTYWFEATLNNRGYNVFD